MSYKRIILFLLFFIHFISLRGKADFADTIIINQLMDSVDNLPISNTTFDKSQKILALSKPIEYDEGVKFALLNIARFYDAKSDFIKAISFYQELEEVALTNNDHHYLVDSYFGMSRDYLVLELIDQADLYLKKVLDYTMKIENYSEVADIYSDIGLYYVEREHFEEGLKYLNNSKKLTQKFDSTYYHPTVNYNIGIAYGETGQSDLALPYFLEYIEFLKKEKDSLSFGNAYGNLAWAYQNIQSYDKAFEYFDSCLYYSHLYHQSDNIYIAYKDMSDAYKDQKKYKIALNYFQKHHNLKDSIVNFRAKQDVNEMRLKFETERKEKELTLAQNKVFKLKNDNQKIWLITGGLFSLLIIISLFFYKKKEDAKRKFQLQKTKEELISTQLKNKELKSQQLKNELSNKEKDLTNLAIDIARKNEFSKDLIEKLDGIIQSKNKIEKSELQKVIYYFHNQLKANEDISLLHKNVNEINQAFYQKLDNRFEKLSTNDKYVLGLIRLNLSNKEISSIKGISTSSAKVLRYRLRKKLQLTPDIDIVKFLQEF